MAVDFPTREALFSNDPVLPLTPSKPPRATNPLSGLVCFRSRCPRVTGSHPASRRTACRIAAVRVSPRRARPIRIADRSSRHAEPPPGRAPGTGPQPSSALCRHRIVGAGATTPTANTTDFARNSSTSSGSPSRVGGCQGRYHLKERWFRDSAGGLRADAQRVEIELSAHLSFVSCSGFRGVASPRIVTQAVAAPRPPAGRGLADGHSSPGRGGGRGSRRMARALRPLPRIIGTRGHAVADTSIRPPSPATGEVGGLSRRTQSQGQGLRRDEESACIGNPTS